MFTYYFYQKTCFSFAQKIFLTVLLRRKSFQKTLHIPFGKMCIAIVYIDGKLVRSQRFFKQNDNSGGVAPIMPPNKEVPLYLGNKEVSNFDATATLLKRWTEPIDPKTVWDNYMKGNGSGKMASTLNDLGIDLSILQNNEEIKKFSLL